MIEKEEFQKLVLAQGDRLYRDLPWRNTRDPYGIWISEVMLQQTQVSRVLDRWVHWLDRFPNPDALASVDVADILEEWQGMGYNRRALALQRAAQIVSKEYAGVMPYENKDLQALPGIGPATAGGIRAFAYGEPDIYLETNVRAVYIHHFFEDTVDDITDKALNKLVKETVYTQDPRRWYYALLDYGVDVKKTHSNPTKRARSYTKQSKFEGSKRQKRSYLLKELLGASSEGISVFDLCKSLGEAEIKAGRNAPEIEICSNILSELEKEGFCRHLSDKWFVLH